MGNGFTGLLSKKVPLSLCLDSAEKPSDWVWRFSFSFFFILHVFVRLAITIHALAANFDFSYSFQPISAHRALFTNPQISLFSNFFIKNGSHGTIHTFKNYFVTMFFSFQFQFLVFSCIQKNPNTILP